MGRGPQKTRAGLSLRGSLCEGSHSHTATSLNYDPLIMDDVLTVAVFN